MASVLQGWYSFLRPQEGRQMEEDKGEVGWRLQAVVQ